MRILSIDPGETSAFVVGGVEHSKAGWPMLHTETWGTWSGLEELAGIVDSQLFVGPDVLVLEDYRIYASKAQYHVGSQVYTIREIGRIEWFAFQEDIPVIYQMAAQAKGRWPNSRMKMYPAVARFLEHPALKRYKEKRKHIIDAYRHLLTYLEVSEKVDFQEVVTWRYNA